MENLRKVEVFEAGTWTESSWESLRAGMIFRMREPDDGSIVDAGTCLEVCRALSDARMTEKGNYIVDVEPAEV